jgi:uncharacterized lipoprotein YmbA
MAQIKALDQELTEELVASMVKRYIHVPTNIHKNAENDEEANAWFAGQVAGFEKAILHFDYLKGEYRDEPVTFFNILLCDGMGYVLSNESCEINEITKEDFDAMVQQHIADQVVEEETQRIVREIALPEPKKLILPGEFI